MYPHEGRTGERIGPPRVAAISVIIPVRDGERLIAMCLRAIQQSSVLPAEVLVVDDGSCDKSGGVALQHGARVLRLAESRGPAAARNKGARAASQPVLLFLDADVLVHPDTIQLAEAALESDGALGALFGAYDDAPLASGLVSEYRNLLHHFTHSTAAGNAWTFWAGCGAIRRQLFLQYGGFDESYRTASVEDIELGLRLSQAGAKIRLIPKIQVCHVKRWTLRGMIRTDILHRAWPWSRLLLRSRRLPADLNLGWRQRAGALFAWLAVGFGAAALVRPGALPAALAAVLALAFVSRPFLGFLVRARGWSFALRAFPLHALFLLYSSATFVVAAIAHSLEADRAHTLVANTTTPEAEI